MYLRFFWSGAVLSAFASLVIFEAFSASCAQQTSGVTPQGAPQVMRLCTYEPSGKVSCQTLTLRGDHYDGVGDGQPQTVAIYHVEQWSASRVRLKGRSLLAIGVLQQRIPGVPVPISKKTYLEAEFTGVIAADGHSIDEGVAKWRIGSQSGEIGFQLTWSAAPAGHGQSGDPLDPPRIMHWCAVHCATLILSNGHYGDQNSLWDIEKWTRDSVIIRRTDRWPYPGIAVLTGRISPEGDFIDSGTIEWTYHPCCGVSTGTFQASWGSAIDRVPGSDGERAERQLKQPSQAQVQQQPAVSAEEQVKRTQMCTSRRIRGVMQNVEDQAIRDPNGALLSLLGAALTGISASAGSAKILDSKDGTDGGRYTSKDPGSFVCRGLFVHGDVKIDTTDNADAVSDITADQMRQIMSNQPSFIEWFKVTPLGGNNYRLTLLPSSFELSKEYTQEFVYP